MLVATGTFLRPPHLLLFVYYLPGEFLSPKRLLKEETGRLYPSTGFITSFRRRALPAQIRLDKYRSIFYSLKKKNESSLRGRVRKYVYAGFAVVTMHSINVSVTYFQFPIGGIVRDLCIIMNSTHKIHG